MRSKGAPRRVLVSPRRGGRGPRINHTGYADDAYTLQRCKVGVPEPVIDREIAETPCGPLYGRHASPDRELVAVLAE